MSAKDEAAREARRLLPTDPRLPPDVCVGDLRDVFAAALLAAETRGEKRGREGAAKVCDERADEVKTEMEQAQHCGCNATRAVAAAEWRTAVRCAHLIRSLPTPDPKP